jgi:hypothetical protein
VEDDPPRGLQIGQDAAVVSLDITLARFTAAQTFLETVLRGILDPLEIALADLLSDGGRQRLVLGSGGVARDYLYLTQGALRNANERDANPSRLHNRIGGEDVNEAAADLTAQKQEDLRLDVWDQADHLRERLKDIVKFCLDVNKTNVFLVEGPPPSGGRVGQGDSGPRRPPPCARHRQPLRPDRQLPRAEVRRLHARPYELHGYPLGAHRADRVLDGPREAGNAPGPV